MNRKESQFLRLKQLNDQLHPDRTLKTVHRPVGGWLRAVRQALGLSLQSLANKLKTSPQAIHQFEKSEARSSISLKHLEDVAEAMGCRLIYTLVPRNGKLADLAASESGRGRRAVGHSMALEGQEIESPDLPY
jgi:predicted DNA-binding mobile mystery protein A